MDKVKKNVQEDPMTRRGFLLDSQSGGGKGLMPYTGAFAKKGANLTSLGKILKTVKLFRNRRD